MLNQFSATPNPIFTVSIVFRVSTELEPRPIYLAIEPMPAQKHHSSYMSQQHSLLAFYWSEQSWWTSDKCCFAKLKTINKRREMHLMLASASKIQLKCWVRFFLVRGTFVGKYKKAFFRRWVSIEFFYKLCHWYKLFSHWWNTSWRHFNWSI